MKKSTKIFAIVLTLALVLGVLAMGISAAGRDFVAESQDPVVGEKVELFMGFEKLPVQDMNPSGNTYITAEVAPKANPVIVPNSRVLPISIVQANQNKYLQVTMDKNTSGASSYVNLYPAVGGIAGSGSALNDNFTSLGDNKYSVLDFDIYFPGNAIARAGSRPDVHFELRSFKADGGRCFPGDVGYMQSSNNLGGIGVNFQQLNTNADAPLYAYYNAPTGWASGSNIVEGQWTHYTLILESNINDAGTPDDDSDDYLNLTYYLAANGQIDIVHVYAWNAPIDASKFWNHDATNVFISDIRVAFGSAADDSVYCYDNITYRTYNREYDGNLDEVLALGKGADLTKWERNAYDPAEMPMGKTAGAKIGDTEYVNLAAAIKAAGAGDVIDLVTDSNIKITVDKAVVINTNGHTISNLATADGFARAEEDGVITITKANKYLTVVWYECDCGEGCIEEIETHVYTGNNIYDSYKAATGKNPVCQGMNEGLSFTKHTGFEDVSGYLEAIDETTLATEDLEGETIELVPTYSEDRVIAIRTTASGAETYILQSVGLTSASCAFENGLTITLMANVDMSVNLWTRAKDVTFDLNGYRLSTCKEGAAADRIGTFDVGTSFTLTSSRVGGEIYNATKVSETKFQGYPVFTNGAANTNIYIDAINEQGENTLSIYAAMVYQAYNAPGNLYINGGQYIGGGAADGMGLFYAKYTGNFDIQNAYFDGGNSVFYFGGAGKTPATAYFNNCVFGTSIAAIPTVFDGLKITMENCYIGGKVNTDANNAGGVLPADRNSAVVLKNTYIRAGVTVNAIYAEGQDAHTINMTKDFNIVKNDWKNGTFATEDTYATAEQTVTMIFDRMITDANLLPVETLWYAADGETLLGTSSALPGSYAIAPVIREVEGTNGMVVESYNDWKEDTYIPLGTTGSVKFTLKEGAEPVLAAGKVNVMFNFDMINHFQYNHYVPEAPEGVQYVAVVAGGATVAFENWRFPNSFKYVDSKTGAKYTCVNSWPNMDGSDTEYGFQVVYTYAGQEFTYTCPNISIPKYVNYIVTNDKYEESDKLRTAMADLVRAIRDTKIAAGKNTSAALLEACEIAAPFMSVAEDVIDTTKVNDISAIKDYIDGISYDAYGYSVAPNVSVLCKEGYAAVFTADVLFGAKVIGDTRSNGRAYYAHNIRSYALAEEFTISVYAEEDIEKASNGVITAKADAVPVGVAVVTCDGFINADTDADAKTTAFYLAFNAYAKSSYAYVSWLKS